MCCIAKYCYYFLYKKFYLILFLENIYNINSIKCLYVSEKTHLQYNLIDNYDN